jgi:hypothetical protein
LSNNKELLVLPFLVVVILLQIVSNPIKNRGYPTIHSINNQGAKDLSKGVPCFADIRCHTLVWNLCYLGFSQPANAHWYSVKSLSEGVPSLAALLGVSNDNLNMLLSLSGFGRIPKGGGLVFLVTVIWNG